MSNWPTGKDNKPLAKVGNGAKETVPTVQFGNITIGPAWVEKFVEDNPKAIENGLKECLVAAETVLGNERDELLDKIKKAGIK